MELSLAIVFFTNIVLSLAALVYIVTGINTDIFTWAKEYMVSLKDDDSAVNTKVCLVFFFTFLLSSSCFFLVVFFAFEIFFFGRLTYA